MKVTVNSDKQLAVAIDALQRMYGMHKFITCEINKAKRTGPQNNAIHLWCEMMADELNERGLYMSDELFKRAFEQPWTKDTFKEFIFKAAMKKQFPGYRSTTQLKVDEVSQIYDPLNAFFSRADIFVPFPSNDTL